ncbi:TIR domain-containing protein [Mesorhizobium sp. KR9-304]|uniref:toll/interleukin-1 receptor domain-containing protein n=1 Tax=Mesorhizobium sp. KR9-304 TaxID=3156614 RepID=UPI0032B3B63A
MAAFRTQRQSGQADPAEQEAAPATVSTNALKIFLSYSRADMAAADALVEALERQGFAVTIDRRDLPYGEEWQKELAGFIAASDTVVWLVSPDSVKSKWCNWELGEVTRLSKRLVPVVVRATPPASLPEALGKIHLLPAQGAYEAATHEADLVKALNTDREWLKKSTSLGEDAREWAAKGRDHALLLRGRALSEAEAWSVRAPRGAPAPASEILELILASRAAQRSGQRRVVAGSVAAALVAVALAAAAIWFGISANEQAAEAQRQRQAAQTNEERALTQEAEAKRQRTVAQANETRAKQERNAALASEVSRVASVAKPYLSSGRPDIAMGFGLDVAPRDREDEAPLSDELELVLRRAHEQMPAARERKVLDNAFRVAVSPDGRLIAVGTAGDAESESQGMLHVFDAGTLAERFRVKVMDDVVSGLDFSADGKSIAAAGGKTPAVWDAESGRQRFPLTLPDKRAAYTKWVEYAPDGSYIALSTNANMVLLYDAATGALLHVLEGDTFEEIAARMPLTEGGADPIVEAVAAASFQISGAASEFVITPDSGTIAITGPQARDGSVKLFDARTGALRQRLTGGASNRLGAAMPLTKTIAISEDGSRVVAAPTQLTIKAWSVAEGALTSETMSRDINTIALTADGRVAISGHNDGSLTLRCLEGMTESVTLPAHTGGVQGIVLDTERARMATLSEDGTAKLWRLPASDKVCLPVNTAETLDVVGQMKPLSVFAGHGSTVQYGAFAPDGLAFYTTAQDGRLRAWRLPAPTYTVPDWVPESNRGVGVLEREIVVSADGKTLFVSDGQVDAITAVDMGSGAATRLEDIEAVAPEGPESKARLFRTPTEFFSFGEKRGRAEGSSYYWSDPISRDGTRVLLTGDYTDRADKPMTLIDTATGKQVAALAIDGRQASYLGQFFSRDSRLVFAGFEAQEPGGEEGLAVWDAVTGALRAFLPAIEGYSSSSNAYASRDGRIVVFDAGSRVVTVKVGDAGAEVVHVPGFGTIGAVRAVSDDGSQLVEARADGTVVLFPVEGQGARTLRLDFVDPVHAEISPDGEIVAVVDVGGVVTIASVADGKVLHSRPLQDDFLAMRFLPDGRIVIVDQAGGITILPRLPGADILPDGPAFVEWLRAKRHGIVSSVDRSRFGLTGTGRRERPDLAAIKPFIIPPRRENPAPTPDAGQCDALAANPYDRDRRTAGIMFETLDAPSALPVCEKALTGAPDDPQTIYQVARMHDRLGHLRKAYEGYRVAADKGYAIAMRGIARLIEVDKKGELPPVGTVAEWMDKAAAAGDPWSLWTGATEMARIAPAGQASAEALAMLASAGSPNRAQAAIVLSWRLAQLGDKPGAAERSRFYALLGLDLYDNHADPEPFNDPHTLDWVLSFVRDMGETMPPAELVALYRQARDWRAPAPH